jgi:exodeoxyribonuclease VII large subunit
VTIQFQQERKRLTWNTTTLLSASPKKQIQNSHVKLQQCIHNNLNYIKLILAKNTAGFRELTSRLQALSPLAILSRGYSITRSVPDGAIIRDAADVYVGQDVEILLARATLHCMLKRISIDGKTDI